ncbi:MULTISPECIES: hypothetical protein [Streptomyces]|uniref:hypothetical protein n=1 Tax=Streptomyces TaxID=1883 RepID=UPI000CD56F6B|nr:MULTISPECIES: hypothetical protein [unclassified Streptomyces]AWL40124.1 hypothetical protein B9S64_20110 [Streptomyces sp. SM18]
MDWRDRHHDATLADILLSERVGVAHIRHVGDLISARAQLSMGMQGPVGLSFDQRADIAEAVIDLEDSYRLAWESVANEPEQRVQKLETLEQALLGAVTGIREIARRNGIEIDCC